MEPAASTSSVPSASDSKATDAAAVAAPNDDKVTKATTNDSKRPSSICGWCLLALLLAAVGGIIAYCMVKQEHGGNGGIHSETLKIQIISLAFYGLAVSAPLVTANWSIDFQVRDHPKNANGFSYNKDVSVAILFGEQTLAMKSDNASSGQGVGMNGLLHVDIDAVPVSVPDPILIGIARSMQTANLLLNVGFQSNQMVGGQLVARCNDIEVALSRDRTAGQFVGQSRECKVYQRP